VYGHFKSLLVGVGAAIFYLVVVVVIAMATIPPAPGVRELPAAGGEAATITFTHSVWSGLTIWAGVPVAFAVGYFLSYRRASRANQPLGSPARWFREREKR
jgi:hypothetical protein